MNPFARELQPAALTATKSETTEIHHRTGPSSLGLSGRPGLLKTRFQAKSLLSGARRYSMRALERLGLESLGRNSDTRNIERAGGNIL